LSEEVLSQTCRNEKYAECSGVASVELSLANVNVVVTFQKKDDLIMYSKHAAVLIAIFRHCPSVHYEECKKY
jgi:hypothetical protein